MSGRAKVRAAAAALCAALAAGCVTQGVRLGINLSNFTGDNAGNWDDKIGFSAGVYGTTWLEGGAEVQVEAVYTMKGAEVGGVDWDLGYLEVPVLLRVAGRGYGRSRPCLLAGIFFGLNVSAELGNLDVKDDTEDLEMGVVIGLGMVSHVASFDIRYSRGLTTTDATAPVGDVFNEVVSLTASIRF